MKEKLQKIWKWIVLSSADPKKSSLTIKMAIVVAIPWILKITGVTCGLGLFCVEADENSLNQLAEGVANIAFGVLNIAGVYGLARKIVLSALGKNKVTKPENQE